MCDGDGDDDAAAVAAAGNCCSCWLADGCCFADCGADGGDHLRA